MSTRIGGGYDPEDYVERQEFYTSKDGTKVGMFIISPKSSSSSSSTSSNGAEEGKEEEKQSAKTSMAAPTILYGYGGFNISLSPSFSSMLIGWLKHFGGNYVVA